MTTVLCLSVWGQAAQTPSAQPKKDWKDRAEYDLFESIRTEQSPQKRLDLLNQWKEKYAATDFKQERNLVYLETYQMLNKIPEGLAIAKEIVANDPKEIRALSWISYYVPLMNMQNEADSAEKAAQSVLSNLDAAFAADKKPQGVDDAKWQQARKDSEAQAHKTLGWVAMIRKNNDAAEQEFTKVLQMNPNDATVSLWMGNVVKASPEKQSEAFYHWARAAAYEGPGALAPAGRKEIDNFITKQYAAYHGSNDGLAELKTQAKASPMPPAGFKVVSKADIERDKLAKEQEFMKNNPQLALWKNIKTELTGPNGQQYFDANMKDAKLPPAALRGKVISQEPATRPKTIVLAMSDDTTPEATLKLEAPLSGKAEPGTTIEFSGVARSYTANPFMVSFDVEKSDISGWPAAAAPAKRPAPAKRKPARR